MHTCIMSFFFLPFFFVIQSPIERRADYGHSCPITNFSKTRRTTGCGDPRDSHPGRASTRTETRVGWRRDMACPGEGGDVTAFQERAPGYSVGSLYTVSSLLHGATSACTVAASVLRDAAAATVHSDPTLPCRTCMRRVSVKQQGLCEQVVLCNTCKRECSRTSKPGVPSGLRCEAGPDASVLADLGVGNETFRQLQDLEDREIDPNDYDVLMRLARKPSTKTCVCRCSNACLHHQPRRWASSPMKLSLRTPL